MGFRITEWCEAVARDAPRAVGSQLPGAGINAVKRLQHLKKFLVVFGHLPGFYQKMFLSLPRRILPDCCAP